MFLGLVLQASVIVIVAMLGLAWQGWTVAGATLYGGGVALLNTAMLVWRWHRGLRDYHCDGERHLKSFHRSFLERFFVVAILLATGLGVLSLAALPLLTGFIVGQLAWMAASLGPRERT
jgi:ATP synthase protein I